MAWETHKYYKAYYLSYAWVELEMLKMKNRGIWFSDEVIKTSDTVTKNFENDRKSFDVKLISKGNSINDNPYSLIWKSDCNNQEDFINLKPWEWVLIWLFYDKWDIPWSLSESTYSWDNYDLISDYTNISIYWSGKTFFGIQDKNNQNVVTTEKTLNIWDQLNGKNLLWWIFPILGSYPVEQRPFLVIANIDNNISNKYCIESTNVSSQIVANYSIIQSRWQYRDRTVQLKVIKAHKWANFVMYNIY